MIKAMSSDDYKIVAGLALKLWPHSELEELENSFFHILESDTEVCLVLYENDSALGFVHLSTRNDYVEGCESTPVGYIEGIFIEEAHRNQGYSKQLIKESEKWARSKGLKELASDCELNNEESIRFHVGVEFEEVNRIVCFKKTL